MQPAKLDSLPADGLEELYCAGHIPRLLDGPFRGRLLPPWAPQPLVDLVPWLGKTFRPGSGQNRLRWVGDRLPFEVRPGRSVFDRRPCLILDYGRRGNPPGVRRLYDELREVAPDLYLGPGLVRVLGRARLWTWFALEPDRSR